MKRFIPTVISVRDPAWANLEHTSIMLWLVTDHINGEIPFSASSNESEPLEKEVFYRCIAGEFGEIAEFRPDRQYISSLGISWCADSGVSVPQYVNSFAFYYDKLGAFFEEANTEVASGSVRGICLVNACMVEAVVKNLVKALRKKKKMSKKAVVELVQLGWNDDFAYQNLILKALGCVNDDQFESLEAIRKIRNEFSHKWRLSLTDEAWRARVIPLFDRLRLVKIEGIPFPEFNLVENLEFLTKMIFASACFALAFHLLAEGHKEGVHSLEAF